MSEAALTSLQAVRCRKGGDRGCGGRREVLEKEEEKEVFGGGSVKGEGVLATSCHYTRLGVTHVWVMNL